MKITDHETFAANPFQDDLKKSKAIKFGWRHLDPSKVQHMVDHDSGESVFLSKLGNVQVVLNDNTEFTKLYGAAAKELLKLSVPGLKMLAFIFTIINRDKDWVLIDIETAMEWCEYSSRTRVYEGLCSLLQHKFLCRKTGRGGEYYINVNYFFNGKRTNLEVGADLKSRVIADVKAGRRDLKPGDIDSVDNSVEE